MSGTRSSKTWFIVHVAFPLVPFFLGGFIRAGLVGFDFTSFSLNTFSAPTLAMSIGLLSLFVNQSIHNSTRSLDDEEEIETLHGKATLFLIYAICSFTIFGVLVLLMSVGDLTNLPRLQKGLSSFQVFVFFASLIPIWFSIAAQKAYKLRSSI